MSSLKLNYIVLENPSLKLRNETGWIWSNREGGPAPWGQSQQDTGYCIALEDCTFQKHGPGWVPSNKNLGKWTWKESTMKSFSTLIDTRGSIKYSQQPDVISLDQSTQFSEVQKRSWELITFKRVRQFHHERLRRGLMARVTKKKIQ